MEVIDRVFWVARTIWTAPVPLSESTDFRGPVYFAHAPGLKMDASVVITAGLFLAWIWAYQPPLSRLWGLLPAFLMLPSFRALPRVPLAWRTRVAVALALFGIGVVPVWGWSGLAWFACLMPVYIAGRREHPQWLWLSSSHLVTADLCLPYDDVDGVDIKRMWGRNVLVVQSSGRKHRVLWSTSELSGVERRLMTARDRAATTNDRLSQDDLSASRRELAGYVTRQLFPEA